MNKPKKSRFQQSILNRLLAVAAVALATGSTQASTVTTSWEYYTAIGSGDITWVAPDSTSSVLAIDWGTGGSGTTTTWGGINWVGSNAAAAYNDSGSVKTWYSHPNVAWGSSYGDNTFYPSSSFPLLGSAVVGGDNHILELRGLNPGQTYKIQFVLADSRSFGAPDDDRTVTISGVNGTIGTSTNYRYGYADGQYAVITANVVADAGGYAVFKPSGFNDNGSIGQQINAMQVLAINNPSLSWTAGDGIWSASATNWTAGAAWTVPNADAILDNASSATAITIEGTQTASTVMIGNGGNNGRFTLSGGTLNAAALIVQGNGSNDPGIGSTTINNVTLNTDGDIGVGRWDLVIGGSSNVTIGGQLRSTSDGSGTGDWGRVTIQDSANVTVANGVNSSGSAWGLTLNGGTLTTPSIRAYELNYMAGSRLTLNGTTMVASQDNGNFIVVDGTNRAFVGQNGAIFNTNGRNITVGVTLNNVSEQNGILTKTGTGTLTLTGANNYSGLTTVSGGKLSLAGSSSLPASGAVTIGAGAIVSNDAAANTSFNIGTLTLNGGTLAATSSPASDLGNFHLKGDVSVGGSTMSTISADVRVIHNETRSFNVGDVDSGSGVDLLVSGKLGHYNGNTWGYAHKDGAGTMKLSGPVEIGGITINSGKLILEDSAADWSAFASGLTNNSQLEVSVTGGTRNLGASPSGTGSMVKSGAGTLNTSNISSSGNVTIANGTLHLTGGHNNFASPSGTTISAGAVLSNNTHSHVKSIIFEGGTLASTNSDGFWGGWMLDEDITVTANTGTSTISASQVAIAHATNVSRVFTVGSSSTLNVTGNFIDAPTTSNNGLTKAGDGTMILANANSYTGVTTVNAGTLVLSGAGNANNSDITMANSANLTFAASDSRSFTRSISGAAGDVTFNVAGNTSASGGGDPTNFAFQNTGTFTGDVVINSGLVAPSGDSAFGDSGNIIKLNAASGQSAGLVATNSISLPGSRSIELTTAGGNGIFRAYTNNILTVAGTISGAGNLVKTDGGTLTLTGTNSYTGETNVLAGKLIINGNHSAATGAVNVSNANTRLAGEGTIGGNTTINDTAIHSPGNSPGVQKFTGDLTYADGSIFEWDIDRALTQTRGTGYDGVNVTGALSGLDGADEGSSFDAKFRIVITDADFSNTFWSANKTWADIFTGSDGNTVKTNWTSIFGGGFQYYYNNGVTLTEIDGATVATRGTFAFTGGNTLTWTAVPEPTSALAGLLLTAGLLRRRRTAGGGNSRWG